MNGIDTITDHFQDPEKSAVCFKEAYLEENA